MTIYIIREHVTPQQMEEMLQALGEYVKLAVDVERFILAGGGGMHSDCEEALLEDGSQQVNVWGADWYPASKEVKYESLINIRPRQNNFSLELTDPMLRDRIDKITRKLLD